MSLPPPAPDRRLGAAPVTVAWTLGRSKGRLQAALLPSVDPACPRSCWYLCPTTPAFTNCVRRALAGGRAALGRGLALAANFELLEDQERLLCLGLIDGVSGEALLYLRGSTGRPAPPLAQWCLRTDRPTLIGGGPVSATGYVQRGGWWLLSCAAADQSLFGLGYPVAQRGRSAGLVVARGADHYYCLGWAQVLACRHQLLHYWRAAPAPPPPDLPGERLAVTRVEGGAPWLQALLAQQGAPSGDDADYLHVWWQCVPPGATVSVARPGGTVHSVRAATPAERTTPWPEPTARAPPPPAPTCTVRLPRTAGHWRLLTPQVLAWWYWRCHYWPAGPPPECCTGELTPAGPRHQALCPWGRHRTSSGGALSFTCHPGGRPGVPDACRALAAGVLQGRVRAVDGHTEASLMWAALTQGAAGRPPASLRLELEGLAAPYSRLVTLVLDLTDPPAASDHAAHTELRQG